jgi:DNA polymerase-4
MIARTILHADMNNCYASIEMLHHPSLRGHPVAVGGDPEERHGITLAKNYETKAYGIKVGQTLWQARRLCPGLIIVSPDYDKYLRFSRMFRRIRSDYSPLVEPFGMNESWADVSGSEKSGAEIADKIRERVKYGLGVTVSVGVSYNKIFAKLGSDMRKPDATTVITEDNFREVVWPLPVEDMFGVGSATGAKLAGYNVKTIGDVARCGAARLKYSVLFCGLKRFGFT